jgi:predicted transcriptional regulator
LRLEEISRIIDCEIVTGEKFLDHDYKEICAADLMSDVLAFGTPGGVLLTGLSNVQSVITAHVAEVKAVVYVRGKRPDADAIKLAAQKKIPLLTTRLSMFEACGRLFQKGLRSGADLGKKQH